MKCAYPTKIESEISKFLPMVQYHGKVVLVDTIEAVDEAIIDIEKESILGFDTETRPSFKKGVRYKTSLLQLAGENCVWLFRLDLLDSVYEKIFSVLSNPKIIKTGVAVKGDISGLCEVFDFKDAAFVEISDYTLKMGILNTGLKNLNGLFFGERISKSVQMSNWASETLNERQLIYAATDAWISRRLYLEVKARFDENKYELQNEYPEITLSFISKVRKIVRDIKAKAKSQMKKIASFGKSDKKGKKVFKNTKRVKTAASTKKAPLKKRVNKPSNKVAKKSS